MQETELKLNCADAAVRLCGYVPDGRDKPLLLVLPGGGYQVCAAAERSPVARRFAELGYAAFALDYSVRGQENPHAVFPGPLLEVAEAVKTLRENAAALGADRTRLYLFGSSAGAHLAGCFGNLWDDRGLFGGVADAETLRPTALVLLYGATEFRQEDMMLPSIYGHGAPFTDEELARWTVRSHLGPGTPPMILFHSAPDPTVPMRYSLDLFAALQAREIPSELHIFGCGEHAYGLGAGTPAEVWPELADRFLRELARAPEHFDRAAQRAAKARRKAARARSAAEETADA